MILPHRLVLVGNDIDNFKRVIKAAVDDEGLEQRVDIRGVRSITLTSQAFTTPQAFRVSPSEIETFGIPPLERRWLCGTPVVASCYTAVRKSPEAAQWVVDPHQIEDFAGAMFNVLSDSDYSRGLSSRGLDWCRHILWQRNISETLSLVKAMIS